MFATHFTDTSDHSISRKISTTTQQDLLETPKFWNSGWVQV